MGKQEMKEAGKYVYHFFGSHSTTRKKICDIIRAFNHDYLMTLRLRQPPMLPASVREMPLREDQKWSINFSRH
jgi:hypothetical protein